MQSDCSLRWPARRRRTQLQDAQRGWAEEQSLAAACRCRERGPAWLLPPQGPAAKDGQTRFNGIIRTDAVANDGQATGSCKGRTRDVTQTQAVRRDGTHGSCSALTLGAPGCSGWMCTWMCWSLKPALSSCTISCTSSRVLPPPLSTRLSTVPPGVSTGPPPGAASVPPTPPAPPAVPEKRNAGVVASAVRDRGVVLGNACGRFAMLG